MLMTTMLANSGSAPLLLLNALPLPDEGSVAFAGTSSNNSSNDLLRALLSMAVNDEQARKYSRYKSALDNNDQCC